MCILVQGTRCVHADPKQYLLDELHHHRYHLLEDSVLPLFLCMAIVTLVIEIFSFLRWLDIISITTLTIGTHILNRTFTLSPHVSNEILFEDAKRMKFGYVRHWPCLLIYFPLLITKFFYYQRVEFLGRLFINLIVLNLQCLLMMLHLHLLLLSLYWKHT